VASSLTITGTAAHRRGLAGQFLVAVVGMLVPQAVRGDAQGGLRDAEAPQDVVEAVGVLGRGAAGGAHVLARRHRLQGALQQGLLLGRLHWDVARAAALGAVAHPQEPLAVREVLGVARVGLVAGDHRHVRPKVPGFLRAQAEVVAELELDADPRVVGRDLGDLGLDLDAAGDPAAVEVGRAVAVHVVRVVAEVGGDVADHARPADPGRVGAKEAQVVVDRGHRELALGPQPRDGLHLAVREDARVGLAERGVEAQVVPELEVEALAVEHGLLGDGLDELGVLLVVDHEHAMEHALPVARALRRRVEDVLRVPRRARRRPPRIDQLLRRGLLFLRRHLLLR
jgi:hypothetical protein